MERFTGSFTQQEPIPEAGIEAALRVLNHGRLHRYNTAEGEIAEAALLEQEFAAFTGARYCLAVASGGYALGCALRALGIGPGDRVLTNAFTLAPVPGAIAALGATPVFVETTEALTIDMEDLAAKAPGAKALLLSHMRGHICDMDRLMAICDAADLPVIEDCAHTMGAAWRGTPSGRHGAMGCYSTQTYKHMNSGEGGLIVSDDPDLMARAILLSGSYMLYPRHRAAPPPEAFERVKYITPNVSGRMDNLRAAILRPQLADLPRQLDRWNKLYRAMEAGLRDTPGLSLITRPAEEHYVASSFQFLLPDWPAGKVRAFLARAAARGVELKWFGAATPQGFTSRHDSWRYAPAQSLPNTDRILAGLIDLRLPLTFSTEDAALIARILRQEAAATFQSDEDLAEAPLAD
ncbi:dTDP-4-amino-4,6-dideoxygalactose transaminase [Defluviimonas denitrificans]|jgi:dTDP-4-amino-4,6-dideoxygalactose transaminase|uniref:dTDP-4-amino-4,6-dideoxygalactose transaminase n=1 Tax=Albidovulum denitrificans TaxID=404881 RepID=A0A2S8S9W1_9RHOB|nr:aminotransferase class I/II-fold pyridoxal phosphate-dependent enzyme [Defluviimonas denitrificans]PQV57584.1 dTDP-4-amino-4,6-dideoxygalactose transaminase [Defluviimonas denitrificans]